MSRKNISKILAAGSAKQKTLLLANHIAATSFGEEGLLTSKEFYALLATIKGPQDVAVYNRIKNAELNLRFFMLNLNQLRLVFLNIVSHYLLIRMSLTMSEQVDVVSDTGENQGNGENQENNNLYATLKELKKQAKEYLIQIKTGVELSVNYMDKTDTHIKEYADKLEEIVTAVQEQTSILLLHRANVAIELDESGYFQTYKLFEDYNDIEVDQKLYERFKALSFKHS